MQIIEDEYRDPSTGWTLRWIGEIWNLSQELRIGQSQRVTETTLKNSYSIVSDYSPRNHKMGIPARHVEQIQGVAGHLQKKSEARVG